MNVSSARKWGRERLAKAFGTKLSEEGISLEVDILLADILKKSRVFLFSEPNFELSEQAYEAFEAYLARRCASEPIAYIVGQKEFYGRDFKTDRHVLIPRPDTELLVEQALALLEDYEPPFRILDIGLGSGVVLLSILAEVLDKHGADFLRNSEFWGLDISREALEVARTNATNLGVEGFVQFIHQDIRDGLRLPPTDARTLIVSNPPYVSRSEEISEEVRGFEPHLALFADNEGLDIIEKIILVAEAYLRDGARLLLEIGDKQHSRVSSSVLSLEGLSCRFHQDLAGKNRVVEVWAA